MNDLVEFLHARIDKDEQVARAASPSPWKDPEEDEADSLWLTRDDAYHIYRWEPARVLREVEAKRRIVALHSDPRGGDPSCSSLDYPESAEDCETLHLFALPYADHPDYDDRWRP